MRYLSGHVPHAISVPALKAFGPDGRLMPDRALADWLGGKGVARRGTVALYDDRDGQCAGMLAWILAYLGHPHVAVMSTRFERWRKHGGELSYRPVEAAPVSFEAHAQPALRATWSDVADRAGRSLLDTRSPNEYQGEEVVGDDPPGHIPGAVNLPWLSLQGERDLVLPAAEIEARLREAGAGDGQEAFVYCRSGPRAAIAWLAMHLAGVTVRLYDGSLLDWVSRSDLPLDLEPGSDNAAGRSAAAGRSSGTLSEN
jgi:thiosulfate/3-mercaptopyruvate sulfurtransferase